MVTSIIYIKNKKYRTNRHVKYMYLTNYGNLTKQDVLIMLYSKQRVLAELKTAHAVERCQALISADIEKFASEKYNEITQLIHKLSTNKICGLFDCSNLISSNDIKKVTSKLEGVLLKELEKRFSITCNTSLELDCQPNQLCDLVEDWRRTKNRTLYITRQVEKLSKSFLHKAVKINCQNEIFFQVTKKLELSGLLLNSLGIDAGEQQVELLTELKNRLEGSIDSIKMKMIFDINEKIAQVYYQIHDRVIDLRLLEKITLIENGLAEDKRYSLMRKEA